jgi:hypothetical protein
MTRLRDVNTTDLVGAIRLGCHTMSHCFNDDDNRIPYGGATVRPVASLGGSMEAHIPGRHLNALLNAEAAAGIELEERAVDCHTRATWFSYSQAPLPLHRESQHNCGQGTPRLLQDHDLREGFHALYALAAFRGSERALQLAADSIDVINRYWLATESWDLARLEHDLPVHVLRDGYGTFVQRLARSIGPLVKLFRSTGHEPALQLASSLKDKALRECFPEDGAFLPDPCGHHAHSTTCVLSSLAQLGDASDDIGLLQRVRAFYDNGLWQLRDQIGWSIEGSEEGNDCLRGEANNTGDIIETALILGRRLDAAYYGDAERMLRSHLLPSQLRDTSFVIAPDNPESLDGRRRVAERLRGAFGFPAPYGHEPAGLWTSSKPRVGFNLDIVGGAVASLCEVCRESTRYDASGHWVNLLFDHTTADIEVQSPYTHDYLRIRLRRPGALHVRVPAWVEADEVRNAGTDAGSHLQDGYLVVDSPPVGEWIGFAFELPIVEQELSWRHVRIRARFRGDEAVAMDNFGTELTFFEPFD